MSLTHDAYAAQGSVTLGPEQGKLGAVFPNFGIEVSKIVVASHRSLFFLTPSFSPTPIL
jgi:hypothetical protein